jgi:hypothetical protein
MDHREEVVSLLAIQQWFVNKAEREQRAIARLARVSNRCWYFAILGMRAEAAETELCPGVKLLNVEEPPSELELTARLEDPDEFALFVRYSKHVSAEIAVDRAIVGEDLGSCTAPALTLGNAIRIRTRAEILFPLVCDHSWSTISGASERCKVSLFEDIPLAMPKGSTITVSGEDLSWVSKYADRFVALLMNPQFETAVEALTTYNHHRSLRVMASLLWAGIESLFQIEAELAYRLATYIAVVLEPRSADRLALHRKLKNMYKVRCKAVHGSVVSEKDLSDHVKDAREILSRLLCAFTESGSLPTKDELDSLTLT